MKPRKKATAPRRRTAASERLSGASGNQFGLNLTPAKFRDRLLRQLDEAQISARGRVAYICEMTNRVSQTVRRWLDPKDPGYPDLPSFARLCTRFDTDANWWLGLCEIKYTLPRPREQTQRTTESRDRNALIWLEQIAQEVREKAPGSALLAMPGDEMEPRIHKGATIIYDASVRDINGNGIYVLNYEGRITVRIVENRIGEGIWLLCDNKQYRETVIKDGAAARKLGLKVTGKVQFWIQLTKA